MKLTLSKALREALADQSEDGVRDCENVGQIPGDLYLERGEGSRRPQLGH